MALTKAERKANRLAQTQASVDAAVESDATSEDVETSDVIAEVIEETSVEAEPEITTPDETTPVDAVEEPVVEPAVATAPVPTIEIHSKLAEALATLVSTDAMNPANVALAQVGFYHGLVRGIIDPDSNKSKAFIQYITEYMTTNATTFGPKKAFRSFNELKGLTSVQLAEFETVLRILIDVADVNTRNAVARGINWSVVESNIQTKYGELLIERLKSFLNI